jgi:hypothetical protein
MNTRQSDKTRHICKLSHPPTRRTASPIGFRVTQPTLICQRLGRIYNSVLPPSPLFITAHCIFLSDGAPTVSQQAAIVGGLLHHVPGILPTPPNPKNTAPPLPRPCADARSYSAACRPLTLALSFGANSRRPIVYTRCRRPLC